MLLWLDFYCIQEEYSCGSEIVFWQDSSSHRTLQKLLAFFCKYPEETVSFICIWSTCGIQKDKYKLFHLCCGSSEQDLWKYTDGAVPVKFPLGPYNVLWHNHQDKNSLKAGPLRGICPWEGVCHLNTQCYCRQTTRSYCWSDQQHMDRDSHTTVKVRNLPGTLVLCCIFKNWQFRVPLCLRKPQ